LLSWAVYCVFLAWRFANRAVRTTWILPFCTFAHEYLNFRGGKVSKSRGAAVDVPYFLSRYDPDALRYYLTATAPETRDTEFSWEDFVERNNNELVATWFQIKEDRAAAATSVDVILRVVDNLKTILAPILPHTAQKLHEYLGYEGQLFGTQQVAAYQEETRSHRALTYDHSGALGTWAPSTLPAPLFKKLDESVIEEEVAQLAE
jgi:methionyl-tRNA synthetase